MDTTLTYYQTAIIEILKYYANLPSKGSKDIEEQLIIDTENNHYQILAIGWEGAKRVYYPIFHVDIKNGRIWVQEDATDFDLVGQLEAKGIPASDIVLAFHAPYHRVHTGYAIA